VLKKIYSDQSSKKNEVILGTLDPTVYTIKPFDAKKGVYRYVLLATMTCSLPDSQYCFRISFEGAGGKPLYWTLKSDEESTKVCQLHRLILGLHFLSGIFQVMLEYEDAGLHAEQLWNLEFVA